MRATWKAGADDRNQCLISDNCHKCWQELYNKYIFTHVQYTNDIIGREIIKDTVIYGVHTYGFGRP
jgi:hypothetical protein